MKLQTDEDLKLIKKIFVDGNYTIDCDEYHAHDLSCLNFNSPETAVIELLRLEVVYYKNAFENLKKTLERE